MWLECLKPSKLYHLINCLLVIFRQFLECLLILLTAPSLLEENNIFSGVRDLFLLLLCTQNGNIGLHHYEIIMTHSLGLLFLLSRPPIIKAIIRVLFQTTVRLKYLYINDIHCSLPGQ